MHKHIIDSGHSIDLGDNQHIFDTYIMNIFEQEDIDEVTSSVESSGDYVWDFLFCSDIYNTDDQSFYNHFNAVFPIKLSKHQDPILAKGEVSGHFWIGIDAGDYFAKTATFLKTRKAARLCRKMIIDYIEEHRDELESNFVPFRDYGFGVNVLIDLIMSININDLYRD